MKLIIYSDLHLHNHHKLMVNSETALSVLDYIKDFATDNNIKTVVSAGDFFHTKAKAYAPHLVQGWLRIKDFFKNGLEHYMLIGNHDMANPNTTMNSVLFMYSDYAHVIPDYKFVDIGNTRLHFLSYTSTAFDNFVLSEERYNVLIGHLDIIGFQMSNGFQAVSGFKMEDFKNFDLVFSGHYHKHQQKENIVYVGSAYQTSFSERSQKKGFIVFDTEDLSWDFIEIPGNPKYEVVNLESTSDLSEDYVEGNFLKIKLQNNEISKTKLREKLLDMGAISVDIIPPEDSREIESYYENELSDDPEELATAYVGSISDLKGYDKRKLLKYFSKIQEVANNVTEYEIQ